VPLKRFFSYGLSVPECFLVDALAIDQAEPLETVACLYRFAELSSRLGLSLPGPFSGLASSRLASPRLSLLALIRCFRRFLLRRNL
jgi:hypothetical protein